MSDASHTPTKPQENKPDLNKSGSSAEQAGDPNNLSQLSQHIQGLLQQMQDKFQSMSDQMLTRIDEMGHRIEELEKNLGDMMTQAGIDDLPPPSANTGDAK